MRRALLATLAFLGCAEATSVDRLRAELELSAPSLDFGEVPLGMTRRLSLTVTNPGGLPLELTALSAAAPFRARASALSVPAHGALELELAFSPSAEGAAQGSLQIESNAEGSPAISVPLSGVGRPGSASLSPARVDLVSALLVPVEVELVASNRGALPVEGPLLTPGMLRPDALRLDGSPLPARLRLEPGRDARLTLSFVPSVAGADDGALLVELCGPQCGLEVEVYAFAGDGSMRLEPGAVDFGATAIGQTESAVVTVFNDGDEPFEVSEVRVSDASVRVSTTRALPIRVAAGSATTLQLAYAPRAAGELRATLAVRSSQGEARAVLRGRAEGPRLEVHPEVIDFGLRREPALQRRSFVVLNAGAGSIRVSGLELSGHAGFSVGMAPGLPLSLGPGEATTVALEWTPTGTTGRYLGELAVLSDAAPLTVPVRARFYQQRCRLEVAPEVLTFGLVSLGATGELRAELRNAGVEACTVLGAELSEPHDPTLTVDPLSFPITLAPGATAPVRFTWTPAAETEMRASFVVHTDEAEDPDRSLQLVGTSKLSIAPPSAGRYLYYWQIGGRSSQLLRVPLQGAPVPEVYLGRGHACVGCHSMSPDGRYIGSNVGIWDTDAEQLVQVSEDPREGLAAWNPDVHTNPPYQYVRNTGTELRLASVTGGFLRSFPIRQTVRGVSWSSRGKLAYSDSATGDLVMVDLATGTAMPVPGASGGGGYRFFPSFSPDGRWLAYALAGSNDWVSARDARVQLVAADGSGVVKTLPMLNDAQGASTFPTWSADGAFLSFASNRPGGAGSYDIYIAPIELQTGTEGPPRNLVEINTPDFEHGAVWSP